MPTDRLLNNGHQTKAPSKAQTQNSNTGIVQGGSTMYQDIVTSRLLLRPVRTNDDGSTDLARFHKLWSNEQAARWSPRGPCKTLEESKAWMAGIVPIPMPTNKIRVSYFVLYAVGNEGLIHPTSVDETQWKMGGVITLLPTDFKLGSEPDARIRGPDDPYPAVELGYLFLPETWGQGFATESVQAVLDIYRRDIAPSHALFPREIQANALAENAGSRRVLEKTGFKEVGQFDSECHLPLVNDAQKHTVVHFRAED
ncbi:hypothetical protein NLG97_g8390 [Lecanicillium saksenae]|uniref:Uncharacterized protein n=1 Tax=Lecanicillium saksenae TaxID=468837 RepID=A0ACC1QMW5_9HYPO|nr:hypothetical protein NLG97_g8390 [Lecanicillium saksenae]